MATHISCDGSFTDKDWKRMSLGAIKKIAAGALHDPVVRRRAREELRRRKKIPLIVSKTWDIHIKWKVPLETALQFACAALKVLPSEVAEYVTVETLRKQSATQTKQPLLF